MLLAWKEPRVLLICDEWRPIHGGISAFNRELATALAVLGSRVMCLVLSTTSDEVKDAAQRDVQLVPAERTAAGSELHLLPPLVRAFDPEVVIGHDHISGSVAQSYVHRYFPEAALVHVVHNVLPKTEPHKHRPDGQRRVEERENLTRFIARDAAVVAAVGAKIARYTQDVVDDGYGGTRVLQLDPGMSTPDGVDRQREVPADPTVLVLGRAQDFELKGLDIAAKALARVTTPFGRPRSSLLVRGAEASECDKLRERLVKTSGLARDLFDVREFDPDVEEVQRSVRRAALSLMPSRVEPFGLVAFDAIGLGTPPLITDKSGAAEALRHLLGPAADRMIVASADDPEEHVANWAAAIQQVLDDLPEAFAYAHFVRSKLAPRLSWLAMARSLMTRVRPGAGS